MRNEIYDACETIDAAIFSGDILEFERERADLKDYIEAWLAKIEEFEVKDGED